MISLRTDGNIQLKLLLTGAIFLSVLSLSFLMEGAIASDSPAPQVERSLYSSELPELVDEQKIFGPKLISITLVKKQITGVTYATTVKDALLDLEIELTDNHVVKPPLKFILSSDTHIRIQKVRSDLSKTVEAIPYSSASVNESTMKIGTSKVTQAGQYGEKEITHKHTYINGELNSTEIVSEVVTIEPINEIVSVGTKKEPVVNTSTCQEMGSTHWTHHILWNMGASPAEQNWLLCVSACESGRQNCRVSGTGMYYGIMQYRQDTYRGVGGTDIWNGAEQLNLALAVYRGYGGGAWGSCNTRCGGN